MPGFPQIAHFFDVNDGIIQLTIAYNFLDYCLSAMAYGPLSEAYGRRKIIQRIGSYNTIKLGMNLCIFGSVLLVLFGLVGLKSSYIMTSFICIFCVGLAIAYPVIFSESLEIFPPLRGTASSVIISMRAF